MISLKIIQTSLGKDFKMPNFKQIEYKSETADIEMKWNTEKEHQNFRRPLMSLSLKKNTMKYLKINTEQNADFEALQNAVLQLKGVASVEVIDDENPESELKKAFAKTKEQLKKGDYETLVNDIFDIITKNNSKK